MLLTKFFSYQHFFQLPKKFSATIKDFSQHQWLWIKYMQTTQHTSQFKQNQKPTCYPIIDKQGCRPFIFLVWKNNKNSFYLNIFSYDPGNEPRWLLKCQRLLQLQALGPKLKLSELPSLTTFVDYLEDIHHFNSPQ